MSRIRKAIGTPPGLIRAFRTSESLTASQCRPISQIYVFLATANGTSGNGTSSAILLINAPGNGKLHLSQKAGG